MSDNSKTIAYLDDSFRKNNIDKISYLFSPNFAFYINGGERQGFEEFANLMKQVSGQIKINGNKMVSEDDIHFRTEFKLPMKTENDEMITQIGFVEVQVHNCIIKSFNLHFHTQESEVEEFHQVMGSSNIAYV